MLLIAENDELDTKSKTTDAASVDSRQNHCLEGGAMMQSSIPSSIDEWDAVGPREPTNLRSGR